MLCYVKFEIRPLISRDFEQIKRDVSRIFNRVEQLSIFNNVDIVCIYDPAIDAMAFKIYLSPYALTRDFKGDPASASDRLHATFMSALRDSNLYDVYWISGVAEGDFPMPTAVPTTGFLTKSSIVSQSFAKANLEMKKANELQGIAVTVCRQSENPLVDREQLYKESKSIVNDLSARPQVCRLGDGSFIKLAPTYLKSNDAYSFTFIIPRVTQVTSDTYLVSNFIDKYLESINRERDYYVSAVAIIPDCLKPVVPHTNNSIFLKKLGIAREKIPPEFLCGISSDVMDEPVLFSDKSIFADRSVLGFDSADNPKKYQQVVDWSKLDVNTELQARINEYVNNQVLQEYQKGCAYLKEKKYDHAICCFVNVFEYYQHHQKKYSKEYLELLHNIASAYRNKDDSKNAIYFLKLLIKKETELGATKQSRADHAYELAEIYFQNKQYAEAHHYNNASLSYYLKDKSANAQKIQAINEKIALCVKQPALGMVSTAPVFVYDTRISFNIGVLSTNPSWNAPSVLQLNAYLEEQINRLSKALLQEIRCLCKAITIKYVRTPMLGITNFVITYDLISSRDFSLDDNTHSNMQLGFYKSMQAIMTREMPLGAIPYSLYQVSVQSEIAEQEIVTLTNQPISISKKGPQGYTSEVVHSFIPPASQMKANEEKIISSPKLPDGIVSKPKGGTPSSVVQAPSALPSAFANMQITPANPPVGINLSQRNSGSPTGTLNTLLERQPSPKLPPRNDKDAITNSENTILASVAPISVMGNVPK